MDQLDATNAKDLQHASNVHLLIPVPATNAEMDIISNKALATRAPKHTVRLVPRLDA